MTFAEIHKFYYDVLAQLNACFMVQKCKSDPQHEKEYEHDEMVEAQSRSRADKKKASLQMLNRKF